MDKLLTILVAAGAAMAALAQANDYGVNSWQNWNSWHRQPANNDWPRWQPPRINSQQYAAQVDRRIDNQQQRIALGVRQGTITPAQAWRNERRLANISQRLNTVQARHDGHVNLRQRQALNRQLHKSGRVIHRQRTN